MPEGAVVIRSPEPELQLQGLRTALSLALGDRPARVYLAGAGRAVLGSVEDSESGRCLVALREARIQVLAATGVGDPGSHPDELTLAEILALAGAASFQQTF